MDVLKQQIEKYVFLLAGIYLFCKVLAITIVITVPDILKIQYAAFSYRIYSMDDLIFVFQLICNPLVVVFMYRDMKKYGAIIWSLLVLAIFYPVYAVLFYLILLFERMFNLKEN